MFTAILVRNNLCHLDSFMSLKIASVILMVFCLLLCKIEKQCGRTQNLHA